MRCDVIANGRKPLRFLSVCSGIEAASQALHRHGFECAAVSEIEPHPCAVLAHRFGASRPLNMPHPDDVPTHDAEGNPRAPKLIEKERKARAAAIKAMLGIPSGNQIPNFGDMSRFQEWPDADYDALFGGTPCQSFSVAGLREGLADPRGNLMLTFGAIAARYRPRWLCWENVPGVLSSEGGRDFASLLGLLTGQQIDVPEGGWQNSGIVPGIADAYGLAWCVLDAQHVRTSRFRRAVPQRRRRVFVVGYSGDWRRAAAVLFDAESLRRDPAPSRSAGERVAPTISARPTGGGGLGTDLDGGVICAEVATQPVANPLTARMHKGVNTTMDEGQTMVAVQQVAPTLRGRGFDATDDGTGKGTPIIPVAYPMPVAGTLAANGDAPGKHGFGMGQQDWENGYAIPVAYPLTSGMAASANRMPHEQGALIPVAIHADAVGREGKALRENPEAGTDGVGVQEGHAYTLEARQEVQAVAFSTEPHKPIGVRQEDAHGNAAETYPGEILRGVRIALGEEAFSQWGLGILDMLQSPEILRSALHGRELRPATFTRRWVVDCALSREEDRGAWAVQSLREAGGNGRASPGWEPSEQRAHELGAYLSELSQPGAQAERFMLDLWRASEGIGLLREALSAVQEARRPSRGEGQPAQTTWKVRRLTPDECEFLQGMPRGITNIPWRGKGFSPDGNRYKELGNSWALNSIDWIGERMAIVDGWDL